MLSWFGVSTAIRCRIMNAISLTAPDVWQQNTFTRTGAQIPSGTTHAQVVIRANYVSGTGASTDFVYFDDLAVTQ